MRNFVAKNDFNRASTHLDRSKEPQLTVEDGLDDYHEQNRVPDVEDCLLNFEREMEEGRMHISADCWMCRNPDLGEAAMKEVFDLAVESKNDVRAALALGSLLQHRICRLFSAAPAKISLD